MRLVIATLLILATLPAPASARDPILNPHVACTLGEDCFILNYVDADPGPGAADYTCGPRAYDGHKGIDIALPSYAAMRTGVPVIATAPGTVKATRDGEPDTGAEYFAEGKDCGNGVVISHGGGWESQYCHLRNGSIAVHKGQEVAKGQPLGLIGLSGRTEYPHAHMSVRHDGKVVDPQNPSGVIACGDTPRGDLWQNDIAYAPGGLIAIGISDAVPSFDAVKNGDQRPVLPAKSPALVVWAFAYGARPSDEVHLALAGPNGTIVEKAVVLEKTQALVFRAVGKRSPGRWPDGDYTGSATLMRGERILGTRQFTLRVEG